MRLIARNGRARFRRRLTPGTMHDEETGGAPGTPEEGEGGLRPQLRSDSRSAPRRFGVPLFEHTRCTLRLGPTPLRKRKWSAGRGLGRHLDHRKGVVVLVVLLRNEQVLIALLTAWKLLELPVLALQGNDKETKTCATAAVRKNMM